MKVLAFLLVSGSLIVGTLASVTAYVPRLDDIDPQKDRVTLNGAVGRSADDPTVPLVDSDTSEAPVVLTAALIDRLKAAGVERVRVKEFALSRWDNKGLFLIAVVGLLAGALILRREEKSRVSRLISDNEDRSEVEDPRALIVSARSRVEDLLGKLEAAASEQEKIQLITTTADSVEEEQLASFIDARPVIVGSHGLTGYAHIMDRFAAAERQLYRSWSSAADQALEESEACLRRAIQELDATLQRLDGHD